MTRRAGCGKRVVEFLFDRVGRGKHPGEDRREHQRADDREAQHQRDVEADATTNRAAQSLHPDRGATDLNGRLRCHRPAHRASTRGSSSAWVRSPRMLMRTTTKARTSVTAWTS